MYLLVVIGVIIIGFFIKRFGVLFKNSDYGGYFRFVFDFDGSVVRKV